MAEITTEQMLFMAEQHLLAGRFSQAEDLARHVLNSHPANASAYRTAGRAILRSGRPAIGIPYIREALKRYPLQLDLKLELAGAHAQTGEYGEAAQLFQSVIAAAPDLFDPWPAMASMLHKQRKYDEAEIFIAEAIRRWPQAASMRFYQGLVLADREKFDDAIAAYREAIRLDQSLPETHANLGSAYKSKGMLAEAIDSFRRSIELNPHIAAVHCNLAVALSDSGEIEQAIKSNRDAIAIDPTFSFSHYNLGNALRSLRRHEEAVQAYMNAVKAQPDLVQAFSNMAMSLNELGRHQLALQAYDHAVEIQPKWAEPRWNRTLTHLLLGDFKRGWSEFDRRNELTPPSSRTFPGPRWEGQRMKRGTILLNYEMGLGDTIHFVRYVPMVAERVPRVMVECQAELRELFESIAGVDAVLTLEKNGTGPRYDVHCSLMRLPQLFNSNERSMPRSVPYLSAPSARVQKWANRIEHNGRKKVGLVWAGSPLHQNDRERSIRLEMLDRLADDRIDFYSLQRGPAAEQAKTPPMGMQLIDWAEEFENFADTAALIENLDLVIAVDTSLAHLAGALGKPVWVLMPVVPDWRWLLNRPDSPWYPTMRLFRQTKLHDWITPLAHLEENLKSWIVS